MAGIQTATGSFIDDEQTRPLVFNFLQTFFGRYDSNRASLAEMYDEAALFSMAVSTAHYNPQLAEQHRKSPLREYFQCSRNFQIVKDRLHRAAFLQQTPESIVAFQQKMPATRHLLNSTIVESVQRLNPPVLFISVHGRLIECLSRPHVLPLGARG